MRENCVYVRRAELVMLVVGCVLRCKSNSDINSAVDYVSGDEQSC